MLASLMSPAHFQTPVDETVVIEPLAAHPYCGTSTADSLLARCGWQLVERILHEREDLGIYRKEL